MKQNSRTYFYNTKPETLDTTHKNPTFHTNLSQNSPKLTLRTSLLQLQRNPPPHIHVLPIPQISIRRRPNPHIRPSHNTRRNLKHKNPQIIRNNRLQTKRPNNPRRRQLPSHPMHTITHTHQLRQQRLTQHNRKIPHNRIRRANVNLQLLTRRNLTNRIHSRLITPIHRQQLHIMLHNRTKITRINIHTQSILLQMNPTHILFTQETALQPSHQTSYRNQKAN